MSTADRCALGVLGAGSYGTALAISTASKGLDVLLWSHRPEQVEEMAAARRNARYLPGVDFPPSLRLCADLAETVRRCPILLIVVPSSAFSGVLTALAPLLRPDQAVAWATKGLDGESGELLSTVAERILPHNPLAAISGPTFAMELARGLPTAIAVAASSVEFGARIAELMHTPTFRIYESHDLTALQLGGAVKNVIAIGAGLSDGLGYGANARTALISRGLAEMIRLGVALGATERGFMGLSGLGDLILTCTDDQSRNRRFGYMLGSGLSPREARQKIGQVVEGQGMCRVITKLADRAGVQMPICHEVNEVVHHGRDGHDAARALLSRALTSE